MEKKRSYFEEDFSLRKELDDLYEEEQRILIEIDRDYKKEAFPCDIAKFKLKEFVSTSNGKGRIPRKPREVRLLEYKTLNSRVVYSVTEDDLIRPRKNAIAPDVLAREVLFNTCSEDETRSENLVKTIREFQK